MTRPSTRSEGKRHATRMAAFWAAPVLVVALSGCSPHANPPAGAATMLLQRAGQATLSHVSGPDDRCLVRNGADPSLTFFTTSAESTSSAGYLLFTVVDYRGPGTYKSSLDSDARPYGSTEYDWSLGSWNSYESSVTITVARVGGGETSGTVEGTLDRFPQTTRDPQSAQVRGTWSCTVGDSTAVVHPPSELDGTFTGGGVRFERPTGWSAEAAPPESSTAANPLAFLASQPLASPCVTTPITGTGGTITACGSPLVGLRPDGMVIGWYAGFLPSPEPLVAPTDSSVITTPAGSGWIVTDRYGCLQSLGDEQLIAIIPSHQLRITACLRGPDIPQLETLARLVIASTALTSA